MLLRKIYYKIKNYLSFVIFAAVTVTTLNFMLTSVYAIPVNGIRVATYLTLLLLLTNDATRIIRDPLNPSIMSDDGKSAMSILEMAFFIPPIAILTSIKTMIAFAAIIPSCMKFIKNKTEDLVDCMLYALIKREPEAHKTVSTSSDGSVAVNLKLTDANRDTLVRYAALVNSNNTFYSVSHLITNIILGTAWDTVESAVFSGKIDRPKLKHQSPTSSISPTRITELFTSLVPYSETTKSHNEILR